MCGTLGMYHNAFLMVFFFNIDDTPTEGPQFFYIPDDRDRCGSDRAKMHSHQPPGTDGKGQVQIEFGTCKKL